MIDETTIYAAAAAIYFAALVVLLGLFRGIPEERRSLCYPVVFVVGLAGVLTAMEAANIGAIAVGTGELSIPLTVNGLVGYTLLWVVAVRIVGLDGKALALVAATPAIQVIAFRVASVTGGLVALLGLLVVVGGHVALGAYVLGPIWQGTENVPDQRRLLHWKSRNLLLFLIGMLIVFAVLSLTSVFDAFATTVINMYMSILIRVGFAGFLFANLDTVGTASLLPSGTAVHDLAD